MKIVKLLLISLGLVALASAQSAPAYQNIQGTAPVSTRTCADSTNVGSIYTQITNPSIVSICLQTGLSSLGSGAFSWVTLPVVISCGATTGNATCANTEGAGNARIVTGIATLASNTAVISGMTPFSTTSSFSCVGNDLTTRANPVQIANTSVSSITLTNSTGASDVINYVCVGY